MEDLVMEDLEDTADIEAMVMDQQCVILFTDYVKRSIYL